MGGNQPPAQGGRNGGPGNAPGGGSERREGGGHLLHALDLMIDPNRPAGVLTVRVQEDQAAMKGP